MVGRSDIRVSPEEFADRRRRAAELARDRGLDALLVWSRGGPVSGEYGDVYYLTDFHTPVPPFPDSAKWSAKGYSALLLPVDGEPILLADTFDDPDDRVTVADHRVVPHLPQAVADVLETEGLKDRKIGLVAEGTLLLRDYRALTEAMDGTEPDFEPAQGIVDSLRYVKSDQELVLMRNAAAVGCAWMNATMGAVQAGHTEAEAIAAGLNVLAENGGLSYDVGVSSGPDIEHFWSNLVIPHWNSSRQLSAGDLLHCDQWGMVQGYTTDFHRSTVVGRAPTAAQRELLEGAIGLVEHIVDGMAVGITFDDLHRRGSSWLLDNGFTDDDSGHSFADIFPSFGHSIGLSVEQPYIMEGETTELQHNVVIAVEALVGRAEIGLAGFEHNVLVTDDGVEILDAGSPDRWWD